MPRLIHCVYPLAAWSLFTAATLTDTSVRDKLIESVWARASFNQTIGANPSVYDVASGTTVKGQAGYDSCLLLSTYCTTLTHVYR